MADSEKYSSRTDSYRSRLERAVEFLLREVGDPFPSAIVLGSGWRRAIRGEPDLIIPCHEIPHFPVSTVAGHPGELAVFSRGPARILTLRGRVHLYEGLDVSTVVFPVRALALWGVGSFLLTNSAGAVNRGYRPGDLMLVRDHVNLLGANPLTGRDALELGVRFQDMTEAYSSRLLGLARKVGRDLGIELREGVYAAVAGPSYETPSEIRMLATFGVDAVGMSTVPETIALNQMGKQVLALSCIANMAAGLEDSPLSHSAVLRTVAAASEKAGTLLAEMLAQL